MSPLEAARVFVPASVAFLIGIALAPFLAHYLYKNRLWKVRAGKNALDGKPAEVFNSLHAGRDTGTPRFGGVLVWGSVLLTAGLLSFLSWMFPDPFGALAFISREQTWLPLAALLIGAFVGLLDDFFEVKRGGGLRLRLRLGAVALTSLLCALWLYYKLGISSISFPLLGHPLELGILFIPLFMLVALFLYAGGVIDGIDGLAGGLFATAFAAYAGIALFYTEYDLAAFCAAIAGGSLAFLWFNVPPARFYLSETGTMGLTLALTVVAFLSDTHAGGKGLTALPIIALPMVATVLSNILQMFGKKVLGRKILRIAPLHHHFEAIGWPPYKVTMRYWIVGVVTAVVGMSIAIM